MDLNTLDKESSEYMRAAEKRCRKIKPGVIPFSPDAVKWIKRKWCTPPSSDTRRAVG